MSNHIFVVRYRHPEKGCFRPKNASSSLLGLRRLLEGVTEICNPDVARISFSSEYYDVIDGFLVDFNVHLSLLKNIKHFFWPRSHPIKTAQDIVRLSGVSRRHADRSRAYLGYIALSKEEKARTQVYSHGGAHMRNNAMLLNAAIDFLNIINSEKLKCIEISSYEDSSVVGQGKRNVHTIIGETALPYKDQPKCFF